MTLTVDDILAPGGLISRALPSFEQRDEQLQMARAVEAALAKPEHLLAEAGTGVGKSFAYLVPAILRADQANQRVVVSTYTIALQEQLMGKDLPFLQRILPVKFEAVLAKGRGNYLCLRRLGLATRNRGKLVYERDEQDQLERVAEWAQETEDGSMQDLGFAVQPGLWAKLRCESGMCAGGRCDDRTACFFRKAREKVEKARLVVVNHALFFSNLALGEEANLLGEYSIAILDEAHTVEQAASDHFGVNVSSTAMDYFLRDVYDERTGRGVLAMIGDNDAIASANRVATAAADFFDALEVAPVEDVGGNGRITRPGIVPNSLSPALNDLAGKFKALRKSLTDEQGLELQGLEQRAGDLAANVEALLEQADDRQAYWLERRPMGRRRQVTLASAPVDVAPLLAERLFDTMNAVVLTSATLATTATSRGGQGRGFDYLRRRLGVHSGGEILLASPFDYRRQAKLYVETQLGDPNDTARFVPAACRAIEHYLALSRGRCFVLFTSFSMLQRAADELRGFCDLNDFDLLVQGGDLPRSAMLKRFREGGRGVLLGNMSFWQGVDVAGEALSNVIITKLPFAVPDAPLIEARIDSIRKTGGNPFGEYQLPEAVIRFKQGFGRLIRSRSDTGIVVVLDHRLMSKPYGRQFIAALPDLEIIRDAYTHRNDPPDHGHGSTPDDLWEFI